MLVSAGGSTVECRRRNLHHQERSRLAWKRQAVLWRLVERASQAAGSGSHNRSAQKTGRLSRLSASPLPRNRRSGEDRRQRHLWLGRTRARHGLRGGRALSRLWRQSEELRRGQSESHEGRARRFRNPAVAEGVIPAAAWRSWRRPPISPCRPERNCKSSGTSVRTRPRAAKRCADSSGASSIRR